VLFIEILVLPKSGQGEWVEYLALLDLEMKPSDLSCPIPSPKGEGEGSGMRTIHLAMKQREYLMDGVLSSQTQRKADLARRRTHR
jgi:hypothetical protein